MSPFFLSLSLSLSLFLSPSLSLSLSFLPTLQRSPALCFGFYQPPFARASSFRVYIFILGTDNKKGMAEFIYKHYPQENDKVESFRRPKTVKRLLPALDHARISITRICMPHRRSTRIRKCFS